MDLSAVFTIEGLDLIIIKIINGVCESCEGDIPDASFNISGDFLTILKMLIGELNFLNVYFSEQIEVDGELNHLYLFAEVLEISLKILNLEKKEDPLITLELSDMRELLRVYYAGAEHLEGVHVPKFFKLLEMFMNLNPEAQEEVEEMDMLLKITVTDVGDYYLQVVDKKFSWSQEPNKNAELEIAMSLHTLAELITQEDDSVAAYMAGKITVKGDLTQALALQEFITMCLDFLDL